MKLKNILLAAVTISLLSVSLLPAGMRYSRPVFIPWGSAAEQLGHGKYPGLHRGPASFQVLEDAVMILDVENNAIKYFSGNMLQHSESLPFPDIQDIYHSEEGLLMATSRAVYLRDKDSYLQIAEENDPKNMYMGFYRQGDRLLSRHSSGVREVRTKSSLQKSARPAIRVTRELPDKLIISKENNSTVIRVPDIASVDYLGSAGNALHYVYAESFVRHVPVKVQRLVYVINERGDVLEKIILPQNQYTYIFREFDVAPDGALYHMQSAEDGIHIFCWEYDPAMPDVTAEYPREFHDIPHFNGLSESEPAIANPPLNKSAVSTATTVTRAEALAIADTHVRHVWTATAANIGERGVAVSAPWVQVGENVSIPYKCGGWNTIAQFDAGIAAGKLAGDINTSAVDWTYSVGNDCSGYVSICWKTAQKYGTSTFSSISWQLSSVNDLLPGDATNKAGSHIRLFVEWTSDGKLLQAEATSSGTPGWFTRYYTWTVSGITGYVPIRYNNISGGQIPPPRPTLLTAISSADSVTLSWTADESMDYTGYKIYRKGCAEETFTHMHSIPKGTRSLTIAHEAGVHYDYRINAYHQDNGTPETGSDVYAVKHLNTGKQILIVDAFDRFGGSGSYALPTHDFAASAAAAMDCRNIAYESCANEAVIDGTVDLKDYEMVWWILGDESTEDETFNDVEQDSVENYLDQGGKFFVSGSEIGWDLDNKGSASDKAFMYDYLKAAYAEDDAGNYNVSGADGSIFTGLTFSFSEDGNHQGTFPEDYPDVLSTKNGSTIAMKYGNNKTAAISYEGSAPGGDTPGKVLVMGFPFETVTTNFSKTELAGFVLRFMGYEVELAAESILPDDFELYQNYPNPFNPNTTIEYRIGKAAGITLNVYNIRGERIRSIPQGLQEPGRYRVNIDGTLWPSGVYLYGLEINGVNAETRKMIISK
jgi:hypothetical protein